MTSEWVIGALFMHTAFKAFKEYDHTVTGFVVSQKCFDLLETYWHLDTTSNN